MLKPITFVVGCENKPDVLARVVLLFHRCAVNIDSMTMDRMTTRKALQITVTIQSDVKLSQRMQANLYKLVDVTSVDVRPL